MLVKCHKVKRDMKKKPFQFMLQIGQNNEVLLLAYFFIKFFQFP